MPVQLNRYIFIHKIMNEPKSLAKQSIYRVDCYSLSAISMDSIQKQQQKSLNFIFQFHPIKVSRKINNSKIFIYFKFRRGFHFHVQGQRIFVLNRIDSISEVKEGWVWVGGFGWLDGGTNTKEYCFIFWHFPIWLINIFCAKNWWPKKWKIQSRNPAYLLNLLDLSVSFFPAENHLFSVFFRKSLVFKNNLEIGAANDDIPIGLVAHWFTFLHYTFWWSLFLEWILFLNEQQLSYFLNYIKFCIKNAT